MLLRQRLMLRLELLQGVLEHSDLCDSRVAVLLALIHVALTLLDEVVQLHHLRVFRFCFGFSLADQVQCSQSGLHISVVLELLK